MKSLQNFSLSREDLNDLELEKRFIAVHDIISLKFSIPVHISV